MESESDEVSGAHRPVVLRKVGFHYIVQTLWNSLPLLLVDMLALTGTIAVWRIAFRELGLAVGIDVSSCLFPILTGFVLINTELGLYPGVRLSPVEEFRRLVVSVTCTMIVWGVGVSVLTGTLSGWFWFLLAVYFTSLLALPICRGWARRILGRWTNWGFPVLVCGDDEVALQLHEFLTKNRHLGLRPVGVIANRESLSADEQDTRYVGGWQELNDVAVRKAVYWAVVAPPSGNPVLLSSWISNHLCTIPHIHVLSELTGLPDQWSQHQQIDGITGIHLQQNLMLPLPRMMKRTVDLVLVTAGGLLLLPLLFYIAVAVKLSSRGPILYGHERIGRGGRRFKAWKFRSMLQHSDRVLEAYLEAHPELREEWEKDHKLRYDPRITRIGRFIRVTSLDELPQLWNVLRGDMSLVGPRPIVDAEVVKYGDCYQLYTMVQPGITGLWQVSGRNNTTYEERVQLDSYYVRNWSPWMDVYLLIRTIRIVMFAEGAY